MTTLNTLRPAKVLLAEDSLDDVVLLEAIMESEKFFFDFVVVRDGEEALDYLNKENKHEEAVTPDIAFIDLNLPKHDGMEILTHMKNTGALKGITACILSTSDEEADIQRATEVGSDYYFVKPLRLSDLEEALPKLEGFELQPEGDKKVLHVRKLSNGE